MNLTQFFERWPKKDARVFFFAGGKEHDRLAAHQLVSDSWRKKVDKLDFVRLYKPSMRQLAEAVRSDPLNSKYRVVVATEMPWEDEQEKGNDPNIATRFKDKQGADSLSRFMESFPRDIVLIISTPAENPGTKNPLSQAIIRKGYWVVLKHVDIATACDLLKYLTGWEDDELIREVVEVKGTSPSALIGLLRTLRLRGGPASPDVIRDYLSGSQQSSIFELVDAIIMKQTDKAMYLVQKSKVSMGQLIGASVVR